MKRPGFIHGIVVAALLSLTAPVLYRITAVIVSPPLASKLMLAMLVCGYVLYLLRLNRARIGNVVLGAGTVLVLVGTFLWDMSFAGVVMTGIILIWIVRLLLAYSSPLMGIIDGALCLLGLGGAAWALDATGSLYWGIWCFLLIQVPWSLIPERPGGSRRRHPVVNVDSFSQAHDFGGGVAKGTPRRGA